MNLKNKINEDINSALKGGLSDIALTLRFLMSVIKNKELEKRTKLSKGENPKEELEKLSELTDEEITGIILGEIKKRKESVFQYEKGSRKELADRENKEIEILKKYVPEEMPEEELRNLIKEKINGLGGVTMKDFGKIMSLIMADVKGRVGGDIVKKIIEEELKNGS